MVFYKLRTLSYEIEELKSSSKFTSKSFDSKRELFNKLEDEKLIDEITTLVDYGRPVEAIRVLKDASGLSLKECKEIIDRLL